MDSPTNLQWTSTIKNIYKVADNNGWHTRALEKSSLANYLKFNTGICKMCDSNSIETTDHFIFECSALNHTEMRPTTHSEKLSITTTGRFYGTCSLKETQIRNGFSYLRSFPSRLFLGQFF